MGDDSLHMNGRKVSVWRHFPGLEVPPQYWLKLKDMTGLHYNPLTKRYWLAPNVDVNYMVYTVKEGAA
jgi:hypothetical protein